MAAGGAGADFRLTELRAVLLILRQTLPPPPDAAAAHSAHTAPPSGPPPEAASEPPMPLEQSLAHALSAIPALYGKASQVPPGLICAC